LQTALEFQRIFNTVSSGGVSAVKESGHFDIKIKSCSQVTRMHFFLQKVDDFFIVVALKTQAASAVSPSE